MTTGNDYRALTIRLTSEQHEAAVRLANEMGVSLNRLVQQALDELIRMDRDMALFRAASILAEDTINGSLAEKMHE